LSDSAEDVQFVKQSHGFSLDRPSPMTYHQLPYTEKELRDRYGLKPVPDNYEQAVGSLPLVDHHSKKGLAFVGDRGKGKPRGKKERRLSKAKPKQFKVVKIGNKYYVEVPKGTKLYPSSEDGDDGPRRHYHPRAMRNR